MGKCFVQNLNSNVTHLAGITISRNVFHSLRSSTLFLFWSSSTKLSVATRSVSLPNFVWFTLNAETFNQKSVRRTPTDTVEMWALCSLSTDPVFVRLATCCRRNSFSSRRNSCFFGSGQPFIGRVVFTEQLGRASLTDVPGMFLPVSSLTHQQ